MPSSKPPRALSDAQIEQFIQDGFVRIDHAFPRELAEQGRAILWHDLPCDPQKPATWTQPVIRRGYYGDEPYRKAVNRPLLHAAFGLENDQIVLAAALELESLDLNELEAVLADIDVALSEHVPVLRGLVPSA